VPVSVKPGQNPEEPAGFSGLWWRSSAVWWHENLWSWRNKRKHGIIIVFKRAWCETEMRLYSTHWVYRAIYAKWVLACIWYAP